MEILCGTHTECVRLVMAQQDIQISTGCVYMLRVWGTRGHQTKQLLVVFERTTFGINLNRFCHGRV